ncbi:ACP S-malonyltransferase [Kutzneria kofuensis]|uniref:[acyl-carrier-protein] S-malonyltransferase n=1 Tax=Kutzneria kofuensis TaxID=103725 RepID=A0A7W9KF07_9PSEU|nr:ACP S-malonyltransferase [Kutzneria kofuensis]MBB5891326.1 [acyl-carrier-protein] S-malonyltransferase [Kutzneria kofuensis]
MSGETAIVFPGMGPSSFSAVGKFMVFDPFARRRVAEADEVLGHSLLDRLFEAVDDYSEHTQLAFLVNSLALADRAVDQCGAEPAVCVGMSFGQKAAAVYSGAMEFGDALLMTAEMARQEREFFENHHQDVVTHSFMRTPRAELDRFLCELAERDEYYDISGYLDTDFFLVSVREQVLPELKRLITAVGGYSMYTMRPPVHAGAFGELRERIADDVLVKYRIEAPKMPVLADNDGSLVATADAMRTLLLDSIDQPIRWPDVVDALRGRDVTRLMITGPDDLFRRLDCTKRNFDVTSIEPKGALREVMAPALR